MRARIYELQTLSDEDSWNLFCLYAFPDCEGNRPPEQLESLARLIVERCGRLPLAVKTVAASMARCSDIRDWQSKLRQLTDVVRDEDFTMQILKLSYHSLPPYLKACFAYFSFFPEDTSILFSIVEWDDTLIHQEYLLYLWIAEGLIRQEKDIEQYDNGLSYLQQLQNLSVGNRQSWRLLLPKKGITTDAISNSSILCQRFLRTISVSQNSEITSIPEHLFDHLRVLRVLDFSGTAISTLPKYVAKLKLLKVLNLSNTKIRKVPDCVRRLKCLEYLDVFRCSSIQRVPDWIGDLKSLSHLNVDNCSKDFTNNYLPKGISNLPTLRTLRSRVFPLPAEDHKFLNVKDLGNLINLQEIHFYLEDEWGLRSVKDGNLERLVKMRILYVGNRIPAREGDIEESNLPTLPEKMNIMKDLHNLFLIHFCVPSWICDMGNLTELTLYECSDYPSLQTMPNLQSLVLTNDSRSRELPEKFGESGGFPKLARLFIQDFPVLEELPALEEGAMQRLEGLGILNCPRVKKVPEGLERLRRLKEIEVSQATGELKGRLKEGGEDWNKLKVNNPNIKIYVD